MRATWVYLLQLNWLVN